MTKLSCWCAWAGLAALFFSGCARPQPPRSEFSMGERVPLGSMTYSVVESAWRTELGESFRVRTPEQRFLLIKLSVTNGGGKDVSIPLLTLEGTNGQTYRELPNGEGVDSWFGLLRTISPGQTQQGNIVFDVPLTSYKLRVPDIADAELEKYVSVEIPLRLDTDLPIQSPITPNSLK
jgi:Domain of unknown function (DUF4352)